MPINQAEYEAEKARLKAARDDAGKRLKAAPGSLSYSIALREYVAAQEALKAFYRKHLGPEPSRAERRCAKGITPVWEKPRARHLGEITGPT